MNKEPVYGNHIGIVVNQDDPETRGRVQIFIPYLTNTIYTGWNETLLDKRFKNIGGGGDLTPELVEKLKNVLPWAECAAPIFGGGTSATHNPSTGITSTNPRKSMGPVKPASALTDPTQKGLLEKAMDKLGSQRTLNFDDQKWGGRCATAVTAIAGAGVGYDPLAAEGIGGLANANSLANGSSTALQNSGFYDGPKKVVAGLYNPQLGDVLVMPNSKDGHTIICIDDGRISGNVKYISDNTGREYYEDYVGGRKADQYDGTYLLRPNEEGAKRWNITMNRTEDGAKTLPAPTLSPADAAEIPGTSVNAFDTAAAGNAEVKEASASDERIGKTINIRTTQYGLGKSQGGWDGTEDKYTNQGISAHGQNLTPGVIGSVSPDFHPGDVVSRVNPANGKKEVYIVSDTADSGYNENSLDVYTDSAYVNNKAPDFQDWTIVGHENEIGRSPESVRGQLAKYSQHGDIPEGRSGVDELKALGKDVKDPALQAGFINAKSNRFAQGQNMTAPNPNFNASPTSASYAGAQPSGMLSIPKPGAKVFVFFLAGDIQKPVYFANALEPETVGKMIGRGSAPDKVNLFGDIQQVSTLGSGEGNLTFNEVHRKDGPIALTDSNVHFGIGGSGTTIAHGATNDVAQGSRTTTTMGDSHRTVNGTDNSRATSRWSITDTDYTQVVGSFDEEQIKAAENLHKLVKATQTQKINTIEKEAPKGEKVPCPVCSTSYPVDKASAMAKKAFKFLRALGTVPWFTYSIDVLAFITSLVLVPFFSIAQAAAINGGSCGNPDCKGGQVPSPQKAIEKANKVATNDLKSKQDQIGKLEQQMGNGGTHSVVASKDIVLSAGLVLDDQPVYSKTGSISHGCSVGPAKSARGTMIVKATGVPQVMHTEATQLPGGNIMLRGGSKIKIIAGSPGIDINTNGKITIGGGSVEIVSADSDLILSSPTMTILKGNGVTIDADDRSGKGGGLIINSNQTKVRGLGVTGNMMLGGGLNMKGELSVPYLNTVGQRSQSGSGSPPDQRVPFSTWAVGPLQINDTLNSIRTALTHFAMPAALLNITNIVKLIQQIYNKLYTITVIEPITTGLAVGFIYSVVWNWHHNHMNEPEDHHHDYTQPRGTYFDDESGVHQSACDESHIPTRARKKGTGPDGGPKTLAGCGGFGFGGGGSKMGSKLNSFGISDQVEGFTGTRLGDKNLKFEYNKDGTINVITPDEYKC